MNIKRYDKLGKDAEERDYWINCSRILLLDYCILMFKLLIQMIGSLTTDRYEGDNGSSTKEEVSDSLSKITSWYTKPEDYW